MLDGDAAGLKGHGEAVGGACGSHYHHGAFAVAAVEGLHEVGLLGLGGQARRGAAALDVNYHQGQLGYHGQADALALERQAGTRGGGDGEVAGEGGADGRAYAGNLVLHLYSLDTKVFALCQLMQDVGGGGDGVRAQEQRQTRLLGGQDQAPGRCRVAVDVGVDAGLGVVALDAVGRHRGVYVVAIVVAGLDDFDVGVGHSGLFGEFVAQEVLGGGKGTVEEPADEAESKDVAALEHALVVHARVGQGGLGHRGDGHLEHLAGDAQLGEGVVGDIEGFFHIGLGERVDVDDDYAAGLEEADVLLEGRGVHGDEHVAAVAGGVDTLAHADLEARDAGQRPLRGAYFGGIVREGRNLVADAGRDIGEDVAGQLHAVAGVTRKSHDNFVENFYVGFL